LAHHDYSGHGDEYLASSIKGEVKKKHISFGWNFCGNNSWILDLMLRLAVGRGKIEPWEATSHLESFILKMRNVPPTELASKVGAGIVPGASPEPRRFTPQGK